MQTTPLWVTVVAALGLGGVFGAVLGALIQRGVTRRGQDLQRSTDVETDRAHRRSEALTTMRWAAEQAVSPDPIVARLGERVLYTLQNSTLLLDEDRALLAAIYQAALTRTVPPAPPPGPPGVP